MLFGDRRYIVTGMGYGTSLTLASLNVHDHFLNFGWTGYRLSAKNAPVQGHVRRQFVGFGRLFVVIGSSVRPARACDSSCQMMMYFGRLDCSSRKHRWVWSKWIHTKQRAGSRGCSVHATKMGGVICTSHYSLFVKLQEMQLHGPLTGSSLSISLFYPSFSGSCKRSLLVSLHPGLLRLNLSLCKDPKTLLSRHPPQPPQHQQIILCVSSCSPLWAV